MTYQEAVNLAKLGKIIKLPGWVGYFHWSYATNEFYFRNKDYYLNESQLKDRGITNRTDWYYII